MKRLRGIFLSRKKAVVAVEWSVVAPFLFLLIFFTSMFAIFTLNYYSFSHTAFAIAQELNMGDKGYIKAATLGFDDYMSGRSSLEYDHLWDTEDDKVKTMFRPVKVLAPEGGRFQGSTNITETFGEDFEMASTYFISRRASNGNFHLPFSVVEEIKVGVYYGFDSDGPIPVENFNTNKGETESGDIVIVDIKYNFLRFFKVTARGYTFIV